MDILKTPRVTNKQLQSLSESVINITTPVAAVSNVLQEVVAAHNAFKDGMQKDAASAAEKAVSDDIRDRYAAGMYYQIKSATFSQDEAIAEKATEMLDKMSSHRGSITRLPYNEETAAIDNFLDYLGTKDDTTLDSLHLKGWIENLNTANQDFKQKAGTYISDKATTEQQESAYLLAKPLVEAINKLCVMMFSLLQISPTDDLNKAYAELEQLIESYS